MGGCHSVDTSHAGVVWWGLVVAGFLMQISTFTSVRDTRPEKVDLTWAELVASFEHDFTRADKLDLPLWSPAVFEGHRSNDAVTSLSCIAIDLDAVSEDAAAEFIARLQDRKLAAAIHTTWSHNPPSSYCLRVVLPLDRPAHPTEWYDLWQHIIADLQAPADESCKDPSRAYFPPAGPPGSAEQHFTIALQGQPYIIERSPTAILPKATAEPTLRLPKVAFHNFAKSLCRKPQAHLQDLGDRFFKVINGEAFAEPGERDTTLFRMSTALGEHFFKYTPRSIAACFALSLDRMSHEPDAPTVEDVEYKIRRAQESLRSEKAQTETQKASQRQLRIQEAFRNGRSEPYRLDEYPPDNRWIIQRGTAYYFWVNGGYEGPYTAADARAAAFRDLMPATPVVSLFTTDARGNLMPKTLEQLVMEHGTVAHNIISDYKAQKSYYVNHERTIVEAPCPLRRLEPTYDEDVARYIELLGGARHEDLKTWIAALTRLDLPCAALFLIGERGTGKSLFAYGHARLWTTTRPTYLDEAMADFNDAMLRCPLTFADESLPRDFRGYIRTAEIRHHIQAVSRPLNRKYLPTSTLIGATRTVVAANNEEVLATAENLSTEDISAIVARYFYIRVDSTLADFLHHKDPRGNGWVDGDKIAKHALWLRDNHKWSDKERFIIPHTDETTHRSLTVRSGIRSAICKWLVSWLLDPNRLATDSRSKDLIIVKNQQVNINVQVLERCWSIYVQHEPCPPTGKLASALAALCAQERYQKQINGKKFNYRTVNTENLIAWAENTGYADREQIIELLINLELKQQSEPCKLSN